MNFINGTKSKTASPWAQNPELLGKIPKWITTRKLTMMTIIWSLGILLNGYFLSSPENSRLFYFFMSLFILLHYITDALDGAVGRYCNSGYIRWSFYFDHLGDITLLGCMTISTFYTISYPLMVISLFATQMIFISHFLSDIITIANSIQDNDDKSNLSYKTSIMGIPLYILENMFVGFYFIAGIFNISRYHVSIIYCTSVSFAFLIYVYYTQHKYCQQDMHIHNSKNQKHQ